MIAQDIIDVGARGLDPIPFGRPAEAEQYLHDCDQSRRRIARAKVARVIKALTDAGYEIVRAGEP